MATSKTGEIEAIWHILDNLTIIPMSPFDSRDLGFEIINTSSALKILSQETQLSTLVPEAIYKERRVMERG